MNHIPRIDPVKKAQLEKETRAVIGEVTLLLAKMSSEGRISETSAVGAGLAVMIAVLASEIDDPKMQKFVIRKSCQAIIDFSDAPLLIVDRS